MPSYVDRIIKIANDLKVPVYKMNFDEMGSDFNLITERL